MAPKKNIPSQLQKEPPVPNSADNPQQPQNHRKNERSNRRPSPGNDQNDKTKEDDLQEEEDFCKKLKVARLSSSPTQTEKLTAPTAAPASATKSTSSVADGNDEKLPVDPPGSHVSSYDPATLKVKEILKPPPKESQPDSVSAPSTPPLPRREVMDLESALYKVTLLSSSLKDKKNISDDKSVTDSKEYLFKPPPAVEQRDDHTAEAVPPQPAQWVTFRLAHPGDASKLAGLYSASKASAFNSQATSTSTTPTISETKKSSTPPPPPSSSTTSTATSEEQVSLWLAEGLGDEDKPPSVYGLLAEVHEDSDDDSQQQPQHQEQQTNYDNPKQLGAALLLTAGWRRTGGEGGGGEEQGERIIRIEWYMIDSQFHNLAGHVWLRLASLALLTDSSLVWTRSACPPAVFEQTTTLACNAKG